MTNSQKLLALALGTISLAGCASKVTTLAPNALGPQQLSDDTLQEKYANAFWKRHFVPDLRPYNYKRIAIEEFVVEFVTRKIEGNNPLSIEYSSYLMSALPDKLLATFCERLESRGLELVDSTKIRTSRAYQRLDLLPNGASPTLDGINQNSSDTGRIKEISLRTASGLSVIGGAADADIEDVEREMLDELNADVALRVRVRVGVFGGHPTIERGSTIWVLSRDVAGNLVADRSLVSNLRIVEQEQPKFMGDTVLDVQMTRYLTAMQELFPPFLNMAFLSRESGRVVVN